EHCACALWRDHAGAGRVKTCIGKIWSDGVKCSSVILSEGDHSHSRMMFEVEGPLYYLRQTRAEKASGGRLVYIGPSTLRANSQANSPAPLRMTVLISSKISTT